MAELSRLYPSVIFHYTATYESGERPSSAWFVNGDEGNKKNAKSNRKQAYKAETERFIAATASAAEGVDHRVEIMPDGRVAADGENRFGECNILAWTNIKHISCGNWHTVGLRDDGTVVACGSNANGQCDVSNIHERVAAISCGRYHTAILLDSGRVIILGELEQEARDSDAQGGSSWSEADFPLEKNLRLDKYVDGWEKMNERIEHTRPVLLSRISRLFWHLARIKPSLSRVRLLRPPPGTDSPVELRITEGGTSDAD